MASQAQIIRAEIDADPLGRGYAGFTHAQVATDLNKLYRTRQFEFMSGDQIAQAIDATEFAGLSDLQKVALLAYLGGGRDSGIRPGSGNFITRLLTNIFGSGSTTLANFAGVKLESITRATELGLSNVTPGLVKEARAL